MKTQGRRHLAALAGIVAAGALALAGCAAPAPTPSGAPTGAEPLKVVASTDVYGDLVAQIGGERVQVTSIIHSPSVDPHEYEASARDRLAIANADVVIENGGGYDDFMDTLIEASHSKAMLIRAVGLSRHVGDTDNEHVWFDLPSMGNLVSGLVDALSQADKAGAAEYRAGGQKVSKALTAVSKRAERVASAHRGASVFATDPVADYLLEELGLKNVTPGDFVKATEAGSEVAPAVLLDALTVLDDGVDLVVVNDQSGSPATQSIEARAKERGIPVVHVTETLPEGKNYQQWMTAIIGEIGAELDAASPAPSAGEHGSDNSSPVKEPSDSQKTPPPDTSSRPNSEPSHG